MALQVVTVIDHVVIYLLKIIFLFSFSAFSDSEETSRSHSRSRGGKKDKKRHKHKHKHKHKHDQSEDRGSGEKRSGDKHKSKRKRKKRNKEDERETSERKRQRIESELIDISSENDDDIAELDENDLEKLEAARAALRAELNGVSDERYDALLEEQYHALESQINEYAAQQRLMPSVEENSRNSLSKDNDFEAADFYRPEVGLAITIPGSGASGDTRLVSDRSKRDAKVSSSRRNEKSGVRRYEDFEVERSINRTKEVAQSEAVVSGELGNLRSIAQGYANSDSEEEGEVDHQVQEEELADDLLEYAMNEIEEVPVSKDKTETEYGETDYRSFEQEYAEIRKRREREKEKKKNKEKKDKDKEKSRQERRERKEKDRERREKEKERRKEREERKEKEREEKKEKVVERLREETDKRSRLVSDHEFFFL